MAEGSFYLGIDGGGSRCRARLEDGRGVLLGEGIAGPATTRIGIERAWQSVMAACEAAASQAGLDRDWSRTHAAIGLAGFGRPGVEAALEKIAHPFASVRFLSDGLAGCLGAHSGADGAVVVAGTGSIGVGLIDGHEIRVGGHGFPISDQGSGADIGLTVVRLALRGADRGEGTSPLLLEVLASFSHDPIRAVTWSEHATPADYAALAPIVVRHAGEGDPVGRRIMEQAADAIGGLLELFVARGVDRLSLVGGLAEAIVPWLAPELRGRLKPPDADAVAGALLVARRRVVLPERQAEREPVPKFRV